jgi:hypothetical protein
MGFGPEALAAACRSAAQRTDATEVRGDGLDLGYVKNAEIGFPTMELEQRIMITAEVLRQNRCARGLRLPARRSR